MFVKRKFKKYKRIQFIVRDDTANPFGINCIIKSYSIGNYAKQYVGYVRQKRRIFCNTTA